MDAPAITEPELLGLTGLRWAEAQQMLSARGFEAASESLQVLDITPERAPRTPSASFGWGEARVVRARQTESRVVVTIAREMTVVTKEEAQPGE